MTTRYKDKELPGGVVFSINGSIVSWSHTAVAYAAFVSALVVGMSLHYHKIVQNQWYGYPEEWFPSVSATIGDRYPERAFFQFFIALTAGPRFILVGLWYLLTRKQGNVLPKVVAGFGIFRTLTCGGWTYVTSSDDHEKHDVFMISYLVATLPWTVGCVLLSPPNPKAIKYRKYLASAFFGTLVPLVYYFIQHKVHRVPGAYTMYSLYEWSLIFFDVGFDAVTAFDFSTFELVVRDVKGTSTGGSLSGRSSAMPEKEKELDGATILSHSFTMAAALDVAADIYNGFIFWSVLTSLGVTVWYFPLWHMGISGFEAVILTTLSPFLLAKRNWRVYAVENQRLIHLLGLSGVAAYLVSPPTARLFVVGFGVSMVCLGWATTLYAESAHPARLEVKILSWVLGLVLSSTVKYAWQTNNPVWPIMHAANGGWNGTGLILGVLAVLRSTRRASLGGVVGDVVVGGKVVGERQGPYWMAACGFGGLLFAMHSLLSDTSTMILWVWEGYPIRGPFSVTHGWCTVAAMSVGLLFGLSFPDLASSWAVYGIGCIGAAVLTCCHNWLGYYGALTLAAYITAISIPIVTHTAKKNPASAFGVGFVIYNMMVFFHVWVVAYAFVPGGPLVRERTEWVMLSAMLQIGNGVFDLTSARARSKAAAPPPPRQTARRHRPYYWAATALVNVLFLCAAFLRFPSNDYTPYHPDERLLTAGIWTIHFSLDNDMWSSEKKMGLLIRDLELDVVGLLESDLQRIIMGNRDTTQHLAEELGMYVDYGPGPNKHTWGAALLSKFPIVNSTHHLLPSPVGELAPAIHATIDAYGRLVDVFVFHSGQEEDKEDRRLQAEYMADLMGSTPRPAILLSYLVTRPKKGNYKTFVSDRSGMHDVDPSDKDRWCEYLLYKGLRRTGYARVSRGSITDTEMQVGKFVIPATDEESDVLEARSAEQRNARLDKDDVAEGLRFPDMFKGKGVRGHRYHVFRQPRYYG